jgi:hypothetical protein
MVNTKAKGRKAEQDLAAHYRSHGYQVHVSQRTSVFTGKFYVSKDNDFFNLFDMLAIKDEYIVLEQVKSNESHVYSVLPKIKAFADKVNNKHITYGVMLRVARRGWVRWKYLVGFSNWEKRYYNLQLDCVAPFTYTKKRSDTK